MSVSSSFTLDKRNAKWLGVCAGLANHSGVDALIVRMSVVLLTLFVAGPLMLLAYVLTAWLANSGTR